MRAGEGSAQGGAISVVIVRAFLPGGRMARANHAREKPGKRFTVM
jgi:hypothetical protein